MGEEIEQPKRLYADIALKLKHAADTASYTYSVPEAAAIEVGCRVRVPFGRRISEGYVINLLDQVPSFKVKEITEIDFEALLLPYQVELALLISDHYWAPLQDSLEIMMPGNIRSEKWGSVKKRKSSQRKHSEILRRTEEALVDIGPKLTQDQERALATFRQNQTTLLLGVAASGKTEVYLNACQEVVENGQQALVLVPEIALTTQLIELFAARFPGQLAVLQSSLTELERQQQWWKVRKMEAMVVVGSRSAVFAPLPNLGLICLDEEGADSYHEERSPRYEATWVAKHLARLTGCRLLLGSATPSLGSYHPVSYTHLTLPTT